MCPRGSSYFTSIDECVPLAIAALPAFRQAFSIGKTCAGGRVSTVEALEALRFCTAINSSLMIVVDDVDADFTSLHDIVSIGGL